MSTQFPSATLKNRRISESSSIQDLLHNVEANDLSAVVNDEICQSTSESLMKDRDESEYSSDSPIRRARKKIIINSNLDFKYNAEKMEEDQSELEEMFRKPSKISYNENLTVICDSSTTSSSPQTPAQDTNTELFNDFKPVGFFTFFWEELTRGYSLHNDKARFSEKRKKVYAFLRIPLELEQFLIYGLLQCIDAFLYLFTFLPLRLFMSIFGSALRIKRWTSAETCDVLKMLIIVCASMLIREIDSSVLYHKVRSQGVIKLYIFYNMLEVADRLFSSLGQDILDALFWTANCEKFTAGNVFRTLGHLGVAIGYATLHSFLVILQATTLNVAFNSHNQAVLAIMMSNNFVELKGSVFKKFAKANLFQMACSDVRERFHIFALLFVVMIRNMAAVNWSVDSFCELAPDMVMVISAEYFVDWLKHAFITKFNEINSEVYKDFTITIAFDVIRSREQSAFSDYSDQVSRRMGFIPIPLSIMIIRVLSQTFVLDNWTSIVIFLIGWCLVFSVKICNGVVMLGQACQHVKKFRDFQARSEYDLFRKRMVEKKSKSAPNSPRMSLIDFSDVLHQPAAGKGFTVSDIMSHWEELQHNMSTENPKINERESIARGEERTPRRALSMANIPRRDRSEPPIVNGEELDDSISGSGSAVKVGEEATVGGLNEGTQLSPKKKVASTDEDELADVTAYKMPEQGVQRIE